MSAKREAITELHRAGYTGCFLIKATEFLPLFKPCKTIHTLQIWYNFEAYNLVFAFHVLKANN